MINRCQVGGKVTFKVDKFSERLSQHFVKYDEVESKF